jgi:hypothetical protein
VNSNTSLANNAQNTQNFELVKLLSEDGDINKVIREKTTSKNYGRHIIHISTKGFVTNKSMIEPLMTYLNQNEYYQNVQNVYVNNNKDMVGLRISFLKSIYGNKYIAVLGALGQPGNTVRVLTDKQVNLGIFKVLDSITGDVLKSIKNVKGNALYDLYLFDKKL